MNISYQTLMYLSGMSILFFLVAAITGHKLKVLMFYIIFLVLSYYCLSNTLGYSKPVNSLPLFQHAPWDSEDVYVVGGYWNDATIYLLIKENGDVKTYAWPMNLDFLDEIKKTQQAMEGINDDHDRWNFKIRKKKESQTAPIKTGLDSYPHIIIPPAVTFNQPEKNDHIETTTGIKVGTPVKLDQKMGLSDSGSHGQPYDYHGEQGAIPQQHTPAPVTIEKLPDHLYSGYH